MPDNEIKQPGHAAPIVSTLDPVEQKALRSRVATEMNKGNTFGLQHGRKSRRDLVLGGLGPKYIAIHDQVKRYRKRLESHVRDARGDVSPGDASLLNLAARYELTVLMVDRLIRDNQDATADQIITWLKTATWAATRRNICVARLDLDGPTRSGKTEIDWDGAMEGRYDHRSQP